MRRIHHHGILIAVIAALGSGPILGAGSDGDRSGAAEARQQIEEGLHALGAKLEALRGVDNRADAEVFAKAIAWTLKYDAELTAADLKLLNRALDRLGSRVAALEAGRSPWSKRKGKVVRGFVSAVDGSTQPYAVIVPAGYDPRKPARLDVVLHGSTRPVGKSELVFLGRFDEGDEPEETAPERDYIELHPLGRVENGYRWAGETDVFEAIEAACRNYAVDRTRIVLRGMSMGASGTWHLGLKHPDRFVALGPYCGYVDTHEFSRTPLANFVPVGPLPPDQEKMLHMLDSVDYAANAGMVPAVACMGDKDVFFQAHEIMGRAMAREGLTMVNLIAPGKGHVLDPATHQEQLRRIALLARSGRDPAPAHVRFVTWTLKYPRCDWLEVLGMGEHYARAELEASLDNSGVVNITEPKNITRFAILPPVAARVRSVLVGGEQVAVPEPPAGRDRPGLVIGKDRGRWTYLGEFGRIKLDGKRPGVQGPIDDAFTTPFLCVRGTGSAWNRAAQAWAEARLDQFAQEWGRYFRGVLPIKKDTEVSDDDVRRFNLVLFGDPSNNAWIARVLPRLPVRWTREECAVGDATAPASEHALVLIQPNPLAEGRYVVFNSGHTFHEKELSTLNYLLFPRLGDWALVKLPGGSGAGAEDVVRSGFFDENWALPRR